MESGTKRCAKEKEGDRISKVRKLSSDIRSFFEQPTNASGECTSVLTHASIQPTDAAQLDSISTLQADLSEPPNVLLDQMISDEEIDEDDVQVISSVDDQSACSIPFLANHTTPNSSKQIESTTIESVGHNSAEAGSIEDNVTDIGLVIYGISQPQNVMEKLLTEQPSLPSILPVHVYEKGGKTIKQYFRKAWLSEYHWLVWSPSKKCAYCKYCILFAKVPQGRCRGGGVLGKLVVTPFQDFKNAKGREGVLDKHESYQYHKDAVLMGKAFLEQCRNPALRIDNVLDMQSQELMKSNRLALKSIVECIIFCGKQGISFRGHRDDYTADPSTNKGNFLALLEFRARTDATLQDFITNAPRNACYTSKTIQNDIIELCGNYVREYTNAAVMKGGYFAIIADEVTDSSNNHTVLGICNRMLDISNPGNVFVKEQLFDFVQLERTNSESVCKKLMESYTLHSIDLNRVRAQTYDTTSSMSSAANGVNGRFRASYPKAIYLPCNAHILNLCISASCKLQPVRNVIDTMNEAHLFFHYSPKRQAFFERVLEECCQDVKLEKLKGLCRTRWVERHEAYENFKELFPAVIMTMDMICHPHMYNNPSLNDWAWDRETKDKANGIASCLKRFENIASFVVQKSALYPLKGIAAKLQRRELDVYEAYQRIDDTIALIQQYRNEIEVFHDKVYDEAKELAEDIGSTEEKPRTVNGRQMQRCNIPAESTTEYFKRSLTIPFLDYLLSEMKERFSVTNRQAVTSILSLLPQIAIKCALDYKLFSFYENDLPSYSSLPSELDHWVLYWRRKMETSSPPETLVNCYTHADPDIFPNIQVLLSIGCIFPVTSSEAERSFSVLRRLKTSLRNRMGEERLASLALMHTNYNVTIDPEMIVERFVRANPRRLFRPLYDE